MTVHLRQQGLIDTPLLATRHVVQIGVGRGVAGAELLASCGVGTMTLVDPQIVEAENVGMSGYRLSDVGKAKADATAARLRDISRAIAVTTFTGRAEHMPDFDAVVRNAHLVKIAVDDPTAQFALADRVQAHGVDALVGGTTGDNRQFFVAAILPEGPPLRDILPAAWKGVQDGYTPPPFFPSSRIFSERVNLALAHITLGLLHYRAGSTLPIAEAGAAIVETPLIIGSNGVHGDAYTPARFIAPRPQGHA